MAFLFGGASTGPIGVSGMSGSQVITGTTRWNTTTSMMEMYDGTQWVALSAGDIKAVTLADMVQNAEDQIATQIEEHYSNNATIQDAFKVWEEANERFKVILNLAEKS